VVKSADRRLQFNIPDLGRIFWSGLWQRSSPAFAHTQMGWQASQREACHGCEAVRLPGIEPPTSRLSDITPSSSRMRTMQARPIHSH
jgi:hypothetical protein